MIKTRKERQMAVAILLIALLLILAQRSAYAIVVAGDASEHMVGDNAGAGWDYSGTINGASGVYLGQYNGKYWALTANHVGAGAININGTTYSHVSSQRVGDADLRLVQIDVPDGDPLANLPNLKLADRNSNIVAGSSLVMIGYGSSASTATEGAWVVESTDTAKNVWRQVGLDEEYDYKGYVYVDGRVKKWGVGTTANNQSMYEDNPTAFMQVSFSEMIEGAGAGVTGDSGGGVFYFNPATQEWELAGIMSMVTRYTGQAGNIVVYGNQTIVVPIVSNLDLIRAILGPERAVPEPSAALLLASGAAIMCSRRRKVSCR